MRIDVFQVFQLNVLRTGATRELGHLNSFVLLLAARPPFDIASESAGRQLLTNHTILNTNTIEYLYDVAQFQSLWPALHRPVEPCLGEPRKDAA